MSQQYKHYTQVSVQALKFNPKAQDLIQKKQEILHAVAVHAKSEPKSILFVGFNPMMLATTCRNISVTEITDDTKKYLDDCGIKYVYIADSDIDAHSKKFDWVVAGEEYFTFAGTEEEQRAKIEKLADLASGMILTTLRDYKNLDFKDREFSQPLAVHSGKDSKLFVEYHHYDFSEKNAWTSTVYELTGSESVMYGPFAKRSMFFKQLAKFSIDAGAKEFFVHKNLMYKSVIKKNYEHVISISF